MELQEERTGRGQLNPVRLIQALDSGFSDEELRRLCLDLRGEYPNRTTDPPLDYDSLGEGKPARVSELVLYFQRRDMLAELALAIRDRRPGARL